jgi:hypothetical protein
MVKVIFLILFFFTPLLYTQQVYNFINRPSSKLPVPYNAQVSIQGNETYYAWFNEMGFYFFTSRNGIIITARRDMLVSTKDQAYRLWATICKEIISDGFYPQNTDIGDSTFENGNGVFAKVWVAWNEDELMYAVIARYE